MVDQRAALIVAQPLAGSGALARWGPRLGARDRRQGDALGAEGLRRAIERKRERADNRPMTAFETHPNDALAAWPIRGLARRFPAKDLATLKTLLQEYAYRLPGDLPHGVKFVRAGGPDVDFYMATDGKGGFWFRDIEHQGFNSRRDLFGALACCAKRQPMTPEQEYALESLWHEIWHNRQTGIDEVMTFPFGHPVRRFVETLNQALARLTYLGAGPDSSRLGFYLG